MKRLPLITSIVICLGAIATIVLNVVSCRSRTAGQPPAPPEPPKEQTPAEEAAAYTARLAKERMEDPAYMADLKSLETHQRELARRRDALVLEYQAWKRGFVASNEAARALFEGPREKGAQAPSIRDELEKLIAADPEGAAFNAKREALDAEIAEHQARIKAVIGARMRRQSEEHAAEEKAMAERYRAAHPVEKLVGTNGLPRPGALDPRWTNALAARAAAAAARQTNAPADHPGSAGIPPAEPGRDEARPSPEKTP